MADARLARRDGIKAATQKLAGEVRKGVLRGYKLEAGTPPRALVMIDSCALRPRY
jgi:hypothetical protein